MQLFLKTLNKSIKTINLLTIGDLDRQFIKKISETISNNTQKIIVNFTDNLLDCFDEYESSKIILVIKLGSITNKQLKGFSKTSKPILNKFLGTIIIE